MLKQFYHNRRPGFKGVRLLRDNAIWHTSNYIIKLVKQFLKSEKDTFLPQQPFYLDLATFDTFQVYFTVKHVGFFFIGIFSKYTCFSLFRADVYLTSKYYKEAGLSKTDYQDKEKITSLSCLGNETEILQCSFNSVPSISNYTEFPIVSCKKGECHCLCKIWKVKKMSHKGMPVSHKGIPVSHKGIPVSHKGILVSHKEIPVSHRGMPVSHKGILVSHKGIPVSHKRYTHVTERFTRVTQFLPNV